MASANLEPRQIRFIEEYMLSLNATQSAVRAGYSEKSAKDAGYELLNHPEVSAELARRQASRSRKYRASADRIVEELITLALSDPGLVVDDDGVVKPLKQWPIGMTRTISQIKIKTWYNQSGDTRTEQGRLQEIRFWDKNVAIQTLGKHLGMFRDKPTLEDLYALLPRPIADALREVVEKESAGGAIGDGAERGDGGGQSPAVGGSDGAYDAGGQAGADDGD